MERLPEHTDADPSLRPEYIRQMSLDEFTLANYPEIADETELSKIVTGVAQISGCSEESVRGDILLTVAKDYAKTLKPDTSLNEVLYLRSYTDSIVRSQMVDQASAEFRDRGIKY